MLQVPHAPAFPVFRAHYSPAWLHRSESEEAGSLLGLTREAAVPSAFRAAGGNVDGSLSSLLLSRYTAATERKYVPAPLSVIGTYLPYPGSATGGNAIWSKAQSSDLTTKESAWMPAPLCVSPRMDKPTATWTPQGSTCVSEVDEGPGAPIALAEKGKPVCALECKGVDVIQSFKAARTSGMMPVVKRKEMEEEGSPKSCLSQPAPFPTWSVRRSMLYSGSNSAARVWREDKEVPEDKEGRVVSSPREQSSSGKVDKQQSSNDHKSAGPKSCVYCGGTKTPLWRWGPAGPKTLCNACGIRFNKMKAGKIKATSLLTCTGPREGCSAPASPRSEASNHKSRARSAKLDHACSLPVKHVTAAGYDPSLHPRKRARSLPSRHGTGQNCAEKEAAGNSDDSCVTGRHTKEDAAPLETALSWAGARLSAEAAGSDDRIEGANLLMLLHYGRQ